MKKFSLKRCAAFGTAIALAATLSGCGGQNWELTELQQQLGTLERVNKTQKMLIDTYLNQLKDLQESNENYFLENNALQQQLNDAQNKVSYLEEALINVKAASEEAEDTTLDSSKKHYADYIVNGIRVYPLVTEASSEMKNTSYSAEDLWVFDTTKLEEDDTSFDNAKDYRKYYILQHNSWYDEYRYTTFYFFSSFFNGSVDLNGKKYSNYFIGEIVDTGNGYIATANHYGEMTRINGNYDTHIALASSNPVPFDTYSRLNDFLIANNLEAYVKDTYTEADLLEINLLLNVKDLDLDYTTGR